MIIRVARDVEDWHELSLEKLPQASAPLSFSYVDGHFETSTARPIEDVFRPR